jgi:hypothetical protein
MEEPELLAEDFRSSLRQLRWRPCFEVDTELDLETRTHSAKSVRFESVLQRYCNQTGAGRYAVG